MAAVSRVLIESGRAVGVEYRRAGESVSVRADREVIVSAGAWQSPQILLLSGIGPAAHLREMAIKVIVDLPGVGANLQEHPLLPVVWTANRKDTFLKNMRLDRAARFALQWWLAKRGPFTTTACHGILFARSRANLMRPDIYLAATALGFDANLWFPGLTKAPVHRFVNIVSINHPKSRGWVKLRSADPAEKPRIFYNMLSEPDDLAGLVAGFKMAREIYSKPPQSGSIEREDLPGLHVTSTPDIEAYIKCEVGLGEHPCGTCAMGTDAAAVLDAQLRVRGIDGLRVADASVMPGIPGGNINIPTIMIGEKAADLIRGRSLPPSHQ